jgi:hypothetical protein
MRAELGDTHCDRRHEIGLGGWHGRFLGHAARVPHRNFPIVRAPLTAIANDKERGSIVEALVREHGGVGLIINRP